MSGDQWLQQPRPQQVQCNCRLHVQPLGRAWEDRICCFEGNRLSAVGLWSMLWYDSVVSYLEHTRAAWRWIPLPLYFGPLDLMRTSWAGIEGWQRKPRTTGISASRLVRRLLLSLPPPAARTALWTRSVLSPLIVSTTSTTWAARNCSTMMNTAANRDRVEVRPCHIRSALELARA